MPSLKHLPVNQWPAADLALWEAAFATGHIFDDDCGPGAHLSAGSRRTITFAYRRWLGYLASMDPETLRDPPAARITPTRVKQFIENLSGESSDNTVAIAVTHLGYAARLIAHHADWSWLGSIKSRLMARTRSNDRFDRLIAPWRLLDHGIELMDAAGALPRSKYHEREGQYRDGLMLALLALWPIRRRSLAALTTSRHVERRGERIWLILHAEDTKSGRAESFMVPEILLPYLQHYLDRIRAELLGVGRTEAFWVSSRGNPMCGQQLYERARRRTLAAFGRAMALHDFRRAAHTFIAMDAPDKVGLIPGVLQHSSLDVGEQHYNLARSTVASRRFNAHVTAVRERSKPIHRKQRD